MVMYSAVYVQRCTHTSTEALGDQRHQTCLIWVWEPSDGRNFFDNQKQHLGGVARGDIQQSLAGLNSLRTGQLDLLQTNTKFNTL